MGEWKEFPLGTLTENLDSRRVPVKESDRKPGAYPYYGASGVVDHIDRYLFEGLHLLIAEDGENLRTRKLPIAFLADGRFWVNNHAHVVRGNNRADTRFLSYALKIADITSYLTGSTMPKLTQGNLQRIPVRIPSLPEQQAIAGILGALDEKIALNKAMNETLEAAARMLFKDWFVDFGPTRANVEGHPSYLALDIWSLFPASFNDAALPSGWAEGTLSQVAGLNPETWASSNYPIFVDYVDLSNTKWGVIEAVTRFSRSTAPSRAQRILRPGDTVVGTVRPGNGSFAYVSAIGLTGSTGFAVLRPKKDIYREIVYLASTASVNIERLAHLADGGAYPAVRPELVAKTEFVTAPEQVVAAFSDLTRGLIDRAEANKQESATLAAARDILLLKLMSGELDVRDVAKKVLEAI